MWQELEDKIDLLEEQNNKLINERDIYKTLYEETYNKYTQLQFKNHKTEQEIRYLCNRITDIERFLNDKYRDIDNLDDYTKHCEYIKENAFR